MDISLSVEKICHVYNQMSPAFSNLNKSQSQEPYSHTALSYTVSFTKTVSESKAREVNIRQSSSDIGVL